MRRFLTARGYAGAVSIKPFPHSSDFPTVGSPYILYIAEQEEDAYFWDKASNKYVLIASGHQVIIVDTFSNLPTTGVNDKLYVTRDKLNLYIWDTTNSQYDDVTSQLNYFTESRINADANNAFSSLDVSNFKSESYANIGFQFKSKGNGPFQYIHDPSLLTNRYATHSVVLGGYGSSGGIDVNLRSLSINSGDVHLGQDCVSINSQNAQFNHTNNVNCTAIGSIYAAADGSSKKFFTAGSYGCGVINSAYRTWASGYGGTARGSSQKAHGFGEFSGSTYPTGSAQNLLAGGLVQTTDGSTVPLGQTQESNESISTNFITQQDSYYYFNCDIIAKNTTDKEVSALNVKFTISNDGGTASLIGSLLVNPIHLGTGIDKNSISVSITNSKEVEVKVTGVASKTINWVGSYYITEVNG